MKDCFGYQLNDIKVHNMFLHDTLSSPSKFLEKQINRKKDR